MRRAALAVPLALVIASSVWAGALTPVREVPPTAFRPVVIPELRAAPSATPRAPRIADPQTVMHGPARAPRPSIDVPQPKVVVVTPSPRPIKVDQTPGKRYGVVEGSRIARAYARSRLSLANYHCLDELWVHESGWRWNAENPYSGAYGIPQALPGTKMAKAGADWRTNPVTQVRWGLGYISGRYGNACSALVHWPRYGWY